MMSLRDIPTITRIHSKPEIVLQHIWEFMNAPKQVKSKASNHGYLHIHHYDHIQSPSTCLLHII